MEVKVMRNVLEMNDAVAAKNEELFRSRRVFVLNLMGSPGSGKTSLLEYTLEALKDEMRLAVIEGDLFTTKDAERIERHGVPVIQINTAGGCHLDAPMVEEALASLDLDALDLLVIENVGNLVCPAEFELGQDRKAVVLSITEGDDKPLKYPLMFKEADIALLNKIDLLPYTDFDMESAVGDIRTIHPGIEVLPVACRTGEGLQAWLDWLRQQVRRKREAV
ncbi:hydrogenase nickel incorporation protein HypB [Selenomonas sputigena]|uniref:Hydrogenase nickel incorporation protein HypB n=1 Tax=Selenomonas sputigena TaxID=69823 RepID=A0ABV3X6V4_9FIRM